MVKRSETDGFKEKENATKRNDTAEVENGRKTGFNPQHKKQICTVRYGTTAEVENGLKPAATEWFAQLIVNLGYGIARYD